MNIKLIRDFRLAAALWVAGVSMCAAADAPPPAAPPPAAPAPAAKPLPADSRAGSRAPENAKPTPAISAEVQKFNDRIDARVAEQAALEAQLKEATEAQRKELLEKVKAEAEARLAAQRATLRQMKEDLRKGRNVAPAIKGK